jgi:TolB-like protein
MMIASLLAVLVAAGPPAAPLSVAAPDLVGIGLRKELAPALTEHYAIALAKRGGITVVTSKQISALLGIERQKQLLGCEEGSESCTAELAAALGSDLVLSGTVAKVGGTYQVNLSLVSTKTNRPVASWSSQTLSEASLFDELASAAERTGEDLIRTLRPEFAMTAGTARRWSWAPAIVAVGCAVGGAALLVSAEGASARLVGPQGAPLSYDEAVVIKNRGAADQLGGGVLIAVGAAALGTAGAMLIFGGPRPVQVSVAPTAGGALFALGGAFP